MNWLDSLVNAVTAFPTLSAILTASYTPTIYQNSRRKRILTRVLKSYGVSIYIGNGKFA